jgi:pantoate--beta-alanine ligase
LIVITEISEWRILRSSNSFIDKKIGFVPTMGSLHDGHLSLIKKCIDENDISIVSIFLNPTQFNNKSDLENYPSNIGHDIQLLSEFNVDYILAPEIHSMYPDHYKYKIIETDFSHKLCGSSRPGHFDGVLTVVMKLLNLTRPDNAYFGEKDYQQYILIKKMVQSFFIDIEIVACPIIRSEDGLAHSSRNVQLSEEERKIAPEFSKLLQSNLPIDNIRLQLMKKGFRVDYIKEIDGRRYGAVFLGKVRLIDNYKI